jgi:hypothetical protein
VPTLIRPTLPSLALAQKLSGVVRIIPWLLVVCGMDAD